MFTVAERRYYGFDLPAWSGRNSRKPQRGTCLDLVVALSHCSSPDPQTNILVNKDGRACLADFALMRIISDSSDNPANSAAVATARWKSPSPLSPERFELKGRHPTKESDCYALGMTIYEVLSGLTPFFEYPPIIASQKTLDGARPTRPQGAEGAWFTDDIWGMLERCWEPQPSDRATASAILPGLEGSTPSLEPSSDVDGPRGGATNADE